MFRYSILIVGLINLTVPAAAQDILQIGTYGNYPPWTISDEKGEITGFEIDMINDMCSRMHASCLVKAVDFEKIFDDLNAHVYDIYIGGLTATAERAARVHFSQAYAATTSGFMTVKGNFLASVLSPDHFILDGNDSDIPEPLHEFLRDMQGAKLAVHVNTIQEKFAESYMKDIVEIRRYTYEEEMYDDVLTGKVDAVMATSWSLYNFVARNGNQLNPPVLFGPILSGGVLGNGLAAALPQGDSDHLLQVNKALSAAIADGTLARLSLKWFGYNIAPD